MEETKIENKNHNMIALYSKQIFFFFLVISGNYISEIFSCNIQKHFSNNRIIKHILGFMTIYFLVILVDEKHFLTPSSTFITTIFLYIWFILISVTSHKYTLIIIGLIFLIYLSNNIISYTIEKETDQNKIKNIKNKTKQFHLFLFIISILLTLYGCIIYMGQKKMEYGKKFNYSTFFLGVSNCKFNRSYKYTKLNDLSYIRKSFD